MSIEQEQASNGSLNDRLYQSGLPSWFKDLLGVIPPIGTTGLPKGDYPPDSQEIEFFPISDTPELVFQPIELASEGTREMEFLPIQDEHKTLPTPPNIMLDHDAFAFDGQLGVNQQDAEEVLDYLQDVLAVRNAGEARVEVQYHPHINGDSERFGNVMGLHIQIGRGKTAKTGWYPLLDISTIPENTVRQSLDYVEKVGLITPQEYQTVWDQHKNAARERKACAEIFTRFSAAEIARFLPWTSEYADEEIVRTLQLLSDYKRRQPTRVILTPASDSTLPTGGKETVFRVLDQLAEDDPRTEFVLTSQVDADGYPVTARNQEKVLKFYQDTGLLYWQDSKVIKAEYYRSHRYEPTDAQSERTLRQRVRRSLGVGDLSGTIYDMDPVGIKDGAPCDMRPEIMRIRSSDPDGRSSYLYGVLVPGSATMTSAQKVAFAERTQKYLLQKGKKELPRLYHIQALKNPLNPSLGVSSYEPDGVESGPFLMRVESTDELMLALEYGKGRVGLLPSEDLIATVRDVLRTTLVGVYHQK